MVREFLNFLYRETEELHQAAFLLAGFSFLSQILAFLRDRGLAHLFGASLDLDLYYAAFRFPDLIFVTVASIVSLSVLVPFIVEKDAQGKEAVKEFIRDIFSFFSFAIVLTAGASFILMPQIMSFLYKGFSPDSLIEVTFLSRILLLSPIFLGVSNLLGSITQAYHRFLVYAMAPVFYNLGIIFGIFVLAPHFGIAGVAWGVAIGSLIHMIIQIPFVLRTHLLSWPRIRFNFLSIRKVVTLSLPRTLTLSTSNLAMLFLVALGSTMAAGSISILSLSQNISSVPLSLIGVSYSLAAFPTLSRKFAENNIKAFVAQMALTVRHIIFWSMPAIALFVVLRAHIVRVLLGSGNFDWSDTRLTAAALAVFAISVLSQSLILLFIRAFYSAGHTLKPLVVNAFSTLVMGVLAYVLVKFYYFSPEWGSFFSTLLKVEDLPGTVVLMLPFGFSLGLILNSILLWRSFEKDFGRFDGQTYRTLFTSFSASVFIGFGAYVGLNIFAPIFDQASLMGIFLQGFLAGLIGIIVGLVVLYLLGSLELKELWKTLHHKFTGEPPVADNPEIV